MRRRRSLTRVSSMMMRLRRHPFFSAHAGQSHVDDSNPVSSMRAGIRDPAAHAGQAGSVCTLQDVVYRR